MIRQINSFGLIMALVSSSMGQVLSIEQLPSFYKNKSFSEKQVHLTPKMKEICGQRIQSNPSEKMAGYRPDEKIIDISWNFDGETKLALNRIYNQTGSSAKARSKVSSVLRKHGCNSSIPNQIDYNEWVASDTNVKTEMGRQSYFTDKIKTKKFGSFHVPGDGPLIHENSNVELRWKNLGFTEECSKIQVDIDAVCSGTLDPVQMLIEESQRLPDENDQVSKGAVGVLGLLVSLFTAHKGKNDEDRRIQAARLATHNDDLVEQNKKNESSLKELKDFEQRSQEGESQITDKFLKIAREEIDRLELEIQKNKETIQKNTQKIRETNIGYKPPHPQDINGGLPIEDEFFEYFFESQWRPYQEKLIIQYGSCRSSKKNETTRHDHEEPGINLRAETCKYEEALQELKSIGQPTDPSGDESSIPDPRFNINHRIQKVLTNMPVCETVCSDELMDEFYKSHGFDGGEAEFCAVSKMPSCDLDKHKEMFIDGLKFDEKGRWKDNFENFMKMQEEMGKCSATKDQSQCIQPKGELPFSYLLNKKEK